MLAVSLTAAAAVAGTIHTFAISQTTGSEGAIDVLQTTVPGGALQAEVGSAASTGLGTPFGFFGKYGPPSVTTTKGIGVVGISTLGWGVVGDNIGGGPALYAFPNKNDGIGLDAESDNREAIYGEAHNSGPVDGADVYADGTGFGVYGFSQDGDGMHAEGATGDGIDGFADTGGDGTYGDSISGYGVEGNSAISDGVHGDVTNSRGAGVAGINRGTGNGVYGESTTGFGVRADSVATPSAAPTGNPFQYAATYSQSLSGPGLYGVNTHNTAPVGSSSAYNRYTGVSGYSTDGAGVYGYSMYDAGVLAESGGENPALGINLDSSSGYEIIAASNGGYSTNSNFNFYVNGNGDEFVGGSVTADSGSFSVTRNPHTDTVTYGAEATEPMVEDVGSAHLVNGTAAVPLAGDFRQTIQDAAHYMVFLTPYGDASLFVASRTPAGFVVRETHGGRSTMDFDYRIVAQRYGVQTGRLPHLATLSPDIAKMRLAALQHPKTSASAKTPIKYAMVAPPVTEGSERDARLARARLVSAAAHQRTTRPPAPPPGFLTGAGIHN